MPNLTNGKLIAQTLVEIDAIKVTTNTPIRFKSGILSPIYVDNRSLPYHPHAWHSIIGSFHSLIDKNSIPYDIIAGMAVGGVPHSSALAYISKKPSIFVRKQAKEHGKQQRVEGGEVARKHVLLVEDLVTTGGSSLSGIAALQEAGATVTDCLAIVSYGFKHATEAFNAANVNLHTLTGFGLIQEVLYETGRITEDEHHILKDWLSSPVDWAERNNII